MNSVKAVLSAAGLAAVSAAPTQAASIDFEDATVGAYASLALPGATLSLAGANLQIVDSLAYGSGLALASFDPELLEPWVPTTAPFRIDFDTAMGSVSISFGDLGFDEDTGFLKAFDSNQTEIGSTSLASEDGGVLALANVGAIAFVTFWSDGPYAGSVYWDDINYETAEVPLPGTLGLLGIGLAGLGYVRRRSPG